MRLNLTMSLQMNPQSKVFHTKSKRYAKKWSRWLKLRSGKVDMGTCEQELPFYHDFFIDIKVGLESERNFCFRNGENLSFSVGLN